MVDGFHSLANRTGSAVVLLLSAGLLVGAADVPAERVVQLGETMPVTVNGQTRQLRIEPAAPGLVLLTQDYADAAALKMGGMFHIAAMYTVGNERVMASTAVARFSWGTARPDKRRIGWTARPYARGQDAVIGPAGLDAPIVRFALHAPRPGERTVSLPMAPTGRYSAAGTACARRWRWGAIGCRSASIRIIAAQWPTRSPDSGSLRRSAAGSTVRPCRRRSRSV